jgi:hypothetical protein
MKAVTSLIVLLTLCTANVGLAQESSNDKALTERVAKLEAEVQQLRKELSELRDLLRSATSKDVTPKLALKGSKEYEVRGKSFTRFELTIENHAAFPNEMFRAAPDLPPCGKNKNSARTWVDIVSSDGKRLYGFCGFTSAENLTGLWFAVAKGSTAPDGIYVILNDREKGVKHKSNVIPIKALK